jgi:hypothetical protein
LCLIGSGKETQRPSKRQGLGAQVILPSAPKPAEWNFDSGIAFDDDSLNGSHSAFCNLTLALRKNHVMANLTWFSADPWKRFVLSKSHWSQFILHLISLSEAFASTSVVVGLSNSKKYAAEKNAICSKWMNY